MLINWFTVIAQIINFLILVWLLKRYLYKPVLHAIEEREKRITSRIEDAEKKEADAVKDHDEFRRKNDEFDRQQNDLMAKAIEDAKAEKIRMLEEARNETNLLRKKLTESLNDEQRNLSNKIIQKTKSEVFGIARKALKYLADASLDEQVTNVFIARLKNLSAEEKNKLDVAFSDSTSEVIVNSAFEFTGLQKTEIGSALKNILGTSSSIKFQISADVISGIELSVNGYKVSWSISEYLDSMEREIADVINPKND